MYHWVVLELLIAVGVIGVLGGMGMLALVSVPALVTVGGAILLVGVLVGVPTGIMYHVRLYQILHPRGQLDKRWLWHPLALHDCLEERERRRVLPWCYVGAAGFFIIVAGIVVAGVGLARALLSESGF